MQVVSNTGSTTLTAAITTTGQTAISVAAGQNLAAGGVIQVDSELMQISSITGLNLVVTRAFAGTSAATHSNAATVTIMAAIEIGPILSSTTALPATSLAITYAQIRVDLTALSGSGTCVTTDAWGTAVLYLSLAAGAHVVDVQTSTTIPWREPCFYVGPVGATALAAAGLALQISGNVTGTSTANLVSTNIAWATSQQQACVGQIITFTSGNQAGKSYTISGASQAGSYLKLGVFPNWPSPYPAAGDGFVLSNVATANALTNAIATLPTLGQILGGDQTPITVTSGVVNAFNAEGDELPTAAAVAAIPTNPYTGTPPTASAIAAAVVAADPAAILTAMITAGVLQYVSGSSGPLQLTTTALANLPAPVNISTEDTIEVEPHHHHR
jgi:hypothetical protein